MFDQQRYLSDQRKLEPERLDRLRIIATIVIVSVGWFAFVMLIAAGFLLALHQPTS